MRIARALRYEYAGGWYHVTGRGNERWDIFRMDADRQRFVALVGELESRFVLEIYGYVPRQPLSSAAADGARNGVECRDALAWSELQRVIQSTPLPLRTPFSRTLQGCRGGFAEDCCRGDDAGSAARGRAQPGSCRMDGSNSGFSCDPCSQATRGADEKGPRIGESVSAN